MASTFASHSAQAAFQPARNARLIGPDGQLHAIATGIFSVERYIRLAEIGARVGRIPRLACFDPRQLLAQEGESGVEFGLFFRKPPDLKAQHLRGPFVRSRTLAIFVIERRNFAKRIAERLLEPESSAPR